LVHAGKGIKDHVRAGIQDMSRRDGIPHRHVYAHVGWREVGGKLVYLHPGGAVGCEDAAVQVDAEVDPYFSLEGDGDLHQAIRASLDLLDVGCPEVTYPITSAAYTSVLSTLLRVRFSLWVKGDSGSAKTGFSTLVQSHFGRYSSQNLEDEATPESWAATEAALESYLHKHKDCLAIIDNYVPLKAHKQQELEVKVRNIIQAIGDGTSRSRMRADGTERPKLDPRGLCIMTGEDAPPSNSSTIGRTVLVHVNESSLDKKKLQGVQDRSRLLPVAMREYIGWLSQGRIHEVRERFRVARELFSCDGAHSRMGGNLATLYTGLEAFLDFAVETGAVTREERAKRLETAKTGLGSSVQSAAAVVDSTPPDAYLEALRALIQSGAVRLAKADQALAEVTTGKAQGIGWVRQEDEEAEVCLDSTLSWAVVRRHYGDSQWPYQQKNLYVSLQQRGQLLAGTGEDLSRPTIRRYLGPGKTRKRVLVFPLSVFADYIPPEVERAREGGEDNLDF
jgi:hypothetical protein